MDLGHYHLRQLHHITYAFPVNLSVHAGGVLLERGFERNLLITSWRRLQCFCTGDYFGFHDRTFAYSSNQEAQLDVEKKDWVAGHVWNG